ncbi:uncharacterized protein HME9304_01364 [Flagellimonas maritima]|uniref:DUF1272 domain-containing protein n=1 Tax=Flagellimonas maritima TaxID=1383885 RepID=A0A2Z4LS11_9FLAO|nr:DUF1272 domain-containing protein [Allomuricauda aurantiaca]AWX44364.1 uncharacterized protein HME9304_01364 [Allomuricauda aurantiaca]
MLELRTNCEHCNKNLPNESPEAMICSFECTYCKECAIKLFKNVCPSCGGNFEKRPIRPKKMLQKHPASLKRVFMPKNITEANKLIKKYGKIKPEER